MLQRRLIFITLFILVSTALSARFIFAQNATKPQTLSLTPFIFEERLQKGQTIVRQIELTNHSQETLRLSAGISDFTAGPVDGQPVFVPEDQKTDSQYNLSGWMKITTQPASLLLPGQKTVAAVSITIPANAEEGSRYSGVLFSYTGQEQGSGGSEVIKKTGTLFFVRVGQANEQGSIASFTTNKHFYTGSVVQFVTQFQNTGNVHLKPKGNIHIYNIWGALVAAVPVNRDALIVLPQTSRSFGSSWQDKWTFGLYRAEAQIYFGDHKFEAKSQISFWIIPIKLLIVILLLAVFAMLLLWKGMKIYNSRLLKKAGLSVSREAKSGQKFKATK